MLSRPEIAWRWLFSIALIFALGSYVARPDSSDDVSSGQFTAWAILGPLWGSVGYWASISLFRSRAGKYWIAASVALTIWIAVALLASWWETHKFEMRMRYNGDHLKQSTIRSGE